MKVDAERCAAVGPSGPGGFERRSTHSVHILLSIAQRREDVEELDFYLELKSFLRRCEAQGVGNRGAFPTLVQGNGIAHFVRTVARAKKICSIQEDAATGIKGRDAQVWQLPPLSKPFRM